MTRHSIPHSMLRLSFSFPSALPTLISILLNTGLSTSRLLRKDNLTEPECTPDLQASFITPNSSTVIHLNSEQYNFYNITFEFKKPLTQNITLEVTAFNKNNSYQFPIQRKGEWYYLVDSSYFAIEWSPRTSLLWSGESYAVELTTYSVDGKLLGGMLRSDYFNVTDPLPEPKSIPNPPTSTNSEPAAPWPGPTTVVHPPANLSNITTYPVYYSNTTSISPNLPTSTRAPVPSAAPGYIIAKHSQVGGTIIGIVIVVAVAGFVVAVKLVPSFYRAVLRHLYTRYDLTPSHVELEFNPLEFLVSWICYPFRRRNKASWKRLRPTEEGRL
ncbi:hypothetical protein BJ508DRAFT_320786 [Ascobolus immersus RN42]|uniref:Uncharacterized protein n=1 Tax=Ascobolus immersus RN42 TaxID=1160509 RepID=A0A3N4INQ5_ASCIM|nr:hypothetical protein BJ508DRAFT_320786 [Ascobolus immersus RN42]